MKLLSSYIGALYANIFDSIKRIRYTTSWRELSLPQYPRTPVEVVNYKSRYLITTIVLALFVSLLSSNVVHGQSEIDPLQIGDEIPNELWDIPLQVVNHPDGNDTITLKEYKDKLIILDFWATWCAPCITSLYKMDTLQKEFAKDLQIIPTSSDPQQKIKNALSKYGWDLFSTYEQPPLKAYFPHRIVPHQVWIKDNKVLAISSHQYGTRKNIADVISEKTVKFHTKKDGLPIGQEIENILTDTVSLYQSTFKMYDKGVAGGTSIRENLILCKNMGVGHLYKSAYSHILNPTVKNPIIWEVDSVLYQRIEGKRMSRDGVSENEKAYENWAKGFFFSYILKFKNSTSQEQLYKIFRIDLNRFFGNMYGISGDIEYREAKAIVLSPANIDEENDERVEHITAFRLIGIIRKNFPSIPISVKGEHFYNMKFPKGKFETDDLEQLKKNLSRCGVDCHYGVTAIPFVVIKQIQI